MTGLFIAFDGIDGCGKTTQAQLLEEYISKETIFTPVRVREPGGTEVGEKIREILLNKGNSMSLETEALLFAAARTQLLKEIIIPSLEEGKIVITDRYVVSSLVYQSFIHSGALSRKDIMQINGLAHIYPSLYFILHVPAVVARERMKEKPLDRVEENTKDMHGLIANGYLSEAQLYRNIYLLDGVKPANLIHEEVVYCIDSKIKEMEGLRSN